MHHPLLGIASLLLASWLSGCGHSSSVIVVSSNKGGVPQTTATLYGANVSTTAAGDQLEIRGGQLWINGRAVGAVGTKQQVRYEAVGSERKLFIDGTERSLAGY